MRIFHRAFHLLVIILILSISASAAIRLPRIIGDHMVLQRQKPVNIWGWASPGEEVKVSFNGQKLSVRASKAGKWSVTLKAMEHGGPFEMVITGKGNAITLKNILIGDVWLGSGQSNMEWPLARTTESDKTIAAGNNPRIRLFTVEKDVSFKIKEDLKAGEWLECTSRNLGSFSAVAYYFGKKLNEEIDVPIGLINSSWGGTRIEPWISWELMSQEEQFKGVKLERYEQQAQQNEQNQAKYSEAMKNDRGLTEMWFKPDHQTSDWKSMELPREWGNSEIGNADGIVWFRKEIDLAGEITEATLSLGPIDDIDFTYINGVQVGTETNYSKPRVYTIKKELLKPGKNVIVVKVIDTQGGGGLFGKPDQLFLKYGNTQVPLTGNWMWKSSVLTTDFGIKNIGPNSFASHLYNAMIAPFVAFPIRGVIWYQGESNAGGAYQYKRLFPMLIKNWRDKWGYEFPFLWVQLANFMEPAQEPAESSWAELREAQRLALQLPKTGQAVILDIGEADDIHPRNKKDVGYRLALNALAVEYGKKIVYSGPVYQKMETNGNRIILSFTNVGSGLIANGSKYGYVNGFAIAGADQKFRWAKAFVEGDKVIVYHDQINNPVAVRYAWSDNPDDANLYNKEGLPASSFKTDDWKWSTQ